MKNSIKPSVRLFIGIMYLIISMAILEAQESLSEKQYAIIPISAFNLSGDLSK